MTDWQTQHATLLEMLIRQPRIGLVADFDGTLSAIVPTPAAARPTPRNRELLAALQHRLALVAVVSGRGVDDLRERLGLDGVTYVGNHGLERWVEGRVEVAPEAIAYHPALKAALDEVEPLIEDGMMIEDKGATVSIHYRLAASPQDIQATLGPVIAGIAQRHGIRFFEGRMIFELRPPVEIDKGTAFAALVRDFALDGAVFIGDDTTDADALRVARELRAAGTCYALAVGVDAPETPDSVREASDILLPGVPGVELFLDWLLNAASASDT